MKVALAFPCYKRPQIAERFIDSVEKFVPIVKDIVVLLQPEMHYIPKVRNINVIWIRHPQLAMGLARNKAIEIALAMINPEILWIADDDIMANENTRIEDCFDLLANPSTGIVAITRQMRKSIQLVSENIESPLVYIGGGFLIRVDTLKNIKWFSQDISDEKEFALNSYIAGYTNYRTRMAYAIHSQGQSFEGGMKQLYEDAKTDKTLQLSSETKYGQDNELISGSRGKYNCGEGIITLQIDSKVTQCAVDLHNRNKK
jgi:hypothetical protein